MPTDLYEHNWDEVKSECDHCGGMDYDMYMCLECRVSVCCACYDERFAHEEGCKNADIKK